MNKVIQLMIKEGQKINFNSVSEKALVSKAYLYREPLIRKTIEELLQQQEGIHDFKKTSDASKDVIIKTLKNKINLSKHRNKLLESENAHLKTQLKKIRKSIWKFINRKKHRIIFKITYLTVLGSLHTFMLRKRI
ncbi:DUF6262 family protein [Bacillus cereus group sp. RP43]|uniref:DUF6262 family protein n=1 Tax=Bacillus cereus group sp. RP43 TaxID=3040260 RepID=UPI003395AC8D